MMTIEAIRAAPMFNQQEPQQHDLETAQFFLGPAFGGYPGLPLGLPGYGYGGLGMYGKLVVSRGLTK